MNEVFVTKTGLFNLLGPATFRFAMFMAGGSQEGTAMRILIDNIDELDINCELVQQQMIPLLVNVGVLDTTDVNRIQEYINTVLGV